MCDCLIIGGGAIGLSLAYELAEHGMSVSLIEKGQLGREASWAGAGLLPPAALSGAIEPIEQLRGLSHQLHKSWSLKLQEETGIDNEFDCSGGLHIAREIGEAATLATSMFQLQEENIQVEMLEKVQLLEKVSGFTNQEVIDSLRSVYYLPEEATVRNPRHLQALIAACKTKGVRLLENTTAINFTLKGDHLESIQTNHGHMSAANYCLATGSWTQQISDLLYQAIGTKKQIKTPEIEPIRGQMLLYHVANPLFTIPINEGPRYLVPRKDGHFLVGSTVEEVGFDKSTTSEALNALQGFAVSLFPQLEAIQPLQQWSGLRPASLDRIPYLGQVPGLNNAFISAGHYRSGLHLSTGSALVLGRLIRGEDPQFDLEPFRLDRG